MGLLSKLKSLLGADEQSSSRGGDVDVTVEREPSDVAVESEQAVKGPGSEVAGEPADDGAGDSEAAAEDAEAPAEDEAAAEESAEAPDDGPAADPVEKIKGIGPSYASRLADADVETVGELAARDAESLADETDVSEKRLGRWIERAKARTR